MYNKVGLIFCFYLFAFQIFAQGDLIMFRDGRELNVKIIQVSKNEVIYKKSNAKNAVECFVDNSLVYMLKYRTRGNVFFTESGERIATNSGVKKCPYNAALVYYKSGKEDVAYNLQMTENVVSYKKQRKDINTIYVPKSDIFLIKYSDGTKDILADVNFSSNSLETENVDTVLVKSTLSPSNMQSEIIIKQEIQKYPCKAIIVTNKNKKLKVYIVEENDSVISYKKDNNEKSSIFKIARENVKSVKYQ